MGSSVQLYKQLGRLVLCYAYRVERSPTHSHFQKVQVLEVTCIRREIHGEFWDQLVVEHITASNEIFPTQS